MNKINVNISEILWDREKVVRGVWPVINCEVVVNMENDGRRWIISQ